MIVLDTNVISELIKPTIDVEVDQWFRRTPTKELFTTTITVAELRYGIEILPVGARKQKLAILIESFLKDTLINPFLPFDEPATLAYAALRSDRRGLGRPIMQVDAQITAIVRACGATVATRNTADFQHTGITLINPWTHTP